MMEGEPQPTPPQQQEEATSPSGGVAEEQGAQQEEPSMASLQGEQMQMQAEQQGQLGEVAAAAPDSMAAAVGAAAVAAAVSDGGMAAMGEGGGVALGEAAPGAVDMLTREASAPLAHSHPDAATAAAPAALGGVDPVAAAAMEYAVQPVMTSVINGEENEKPAPDGEAAVADEYEGEGDDPAPMPTESEDADLLREQQDRYLPIANVSRIMKMALPGPHGKIARDAKECVQEAVSEFVSFITSEASDRCLSEKRKTITSDDIIVAMQTLGFDNYIDPLRQYISNYRYAMNKSKGNKRTAEESKETDGIESGFANPADNAAVAGEEIGMGMGAASVRNPDSEAPGSAFNEADNTSMFGAMA